MEIRFLIIKNKIEIDNNINRKKIANSVIILVAENRLLMIFIMMLDYSIEIEIF